MNDLTDIAQQIYDCKEELEKLRKQIRPLMEKKAAKIAEYEKTLALTIMKLKNGVEFELDGVKVSKPPVSSSLSIAKGLCYKEKLEKDLAEGYYNALQSNIHVVKAQLNGLQSINKHLE